jgi:hypothetical protein
MTFLLKKISKTGAILCCLYAIIIVACLLIPYIFDNIDNKGLFVLHQLPIALQMSLCTPNLCSSLSWFGAYALFALPTFLLLYIVGLGIEVVIKLVLKKNNGAGID